MKHSGIFLFLLIILLSCSSKNSAYKDFESNFSMVDSLIFNNERTLLYLTTEWCQAGNNGLNYGLIPLKEKHPDINIIIVYIGSNSNEELNRINNTIEHIYTSASLVNFAYTDKKKMGSILKNYFNYANHKGGVPILLLLDENKNILHLRHALRLEALENLYFSTFDEEEID